jgi:hypothetical protein
MPTAPPADINGMNLVGRYSHLEQTHYRLDFLEFLLQNSAICVTAEQIGTLWNLHVEHPLTPEEREMFFEWLGRVSVSPAVFARQTRMRSSESGFTDALIKWLFEQKMLRGIDCAHLSRSGFSLFRTYFLYVNYREGLIKPLETPPGSLPYYCASYPPLGIDVMWQLALESLDEQLAASAIVTLNQLFQHVPQESTRTKSKANREAYIRSCVKKLATVVADVAGASPMVVGSRPKTGKIERCLVMLIDLVRMFEKPHKNNVVTVAQARPVSPVSST